MKILLRNMCKKEILLIFDAYKYSLKPYEVRELEYLKAEKVNICISPIGNSFIRNDLYHFVLESNYLFESINDVKELVITREKIRFTYNAYYDRLFLLADGLLCSPKSIFIKDEKSIRKARKKNQFIKNLYQPFDDFLGPPLLFFIIGVVLSFAFGWKFSILYFLCLYLFLILIDFLSKKVTKFFFKKTCNFDEEKDFYNYLTKEYILNYYSMLTREAFMGEIEVDGIDSKENTGNGSVC